MIDLHTSVEQKNREKQELETDLYSVGWRNGLIRFEAIQLEKLRNRGAE